jgi:alcohol dehydrogenase
MAAHEYPAMLELVVSGVLRPDRLVGSVIGLDGAADALTAMDSNAGNGMTVIAL